MKKTNFLLGVVAFSLACGASFADVPKFEPSPEWQLVQAGDTKSVNTVKTGAKDFFEKTDKDAAKVGKDIKQGVKNDAEKVKSSTDKMIEKTKQGAEHAETKTKTEYNKLKDDLKK